MKVGITIQEADPGVGALTLLGFWPYVLLEFNRPTTGEEDLALAIGLGGGIEADRRTLAVALRQIASWIEGEPDEAAAVEPGEDVAA